MATATAKRKAINLPAPASTLRSIQLPSIGAEWPEQGGIFVGIRKHDGTDIAVIVPLDAASDIAPAPWKDAIAKAAAFKTKQHQDFVAADRFDLALAFMNTNGIFRKEWYWSSSPHAGDPSSAWLQSFYDGTQYHHPKDLAYRARAVRRLILP